MRNASLVCHDANRASAAHGIPSFGHRVGWLLTWLITWGLFTGADQATPKHLVVTTIDDPACVDALHDFSQHPDADIQLARPAWRTAYRDVSLTPMRDMTAAYQHGNTLWRQGAFEQALEATDIAAADLHAVVDIFAIAMASELAQLRLTIHTLYGHDDRAYQEAVLLLSRHSPSAYCATTPYPEACALLKRIEATTPVYWADPDKDLPVLSSYADRAQRTLVILSSANDNGTTWTRVTSGVRADGMTRSAACDTTAFWSQGFHAWEEHLRQQRDPSYLLRASRTLATTEQRIARIVFPIVTASLLGLAITRTVHMTHARNTLDDCLQSTRHCADHAALQHAQENWIRARRQSIALWSSVGVATAVAIPVGLHARKRARTFARESESAEP